MARLFEVLRQHGTHSSPHAPKCQTGKAGGPGRYGSYGLGVTTQPSLSDLAGGFEYNSGGFDLATALGTSSFWVLALGGLAAYYILFGQESAKERNRRLRAAGQRYQRETKAIKSEYTRTRRRKGARAVGGINSKYSECDVGPSGKVWSRGAWRKPENADC